jgi:hypothetical protein
MLQVLRDPEVLKLTGSVHDEAAELVPENPAEEKKASTSTSISRCGCCPS